MTTGDDDADRPAPAATSAAPRRPRKPRELVFVGLSDDGSALSLADSRGAPYEVRLEGRLAAALRLDHRSGQMEIALTSLTPREIQSRIRQGSSVDELVEETGWESARIERFAGPPLAERMFMADQARQVAIATPDGGTTLAELVDTAALDAGVSLEAIRWDAWQREDGVWSVIAAFPAGSADRVHTWSFDHRAHIVEPVDDAARGILGSRGPVLTVVADEPPAPSAPSTRSPRKGGSASPPPSDESAEADETGADPAPPVPVDEEAPAPAKSTRRGRRASVPTWDEILFGAGDDGDAS